MILSAPLPPLPPSHDDAQSFYAEMDAILDGPLEVPEVCSNDDEETQLHAALFDKMQRYFAFLEAGYDRYLDQEATIEYYVSRLLAAQWFKEHRQGVETCMLDLSGRAKSLPALLISYDVILAYGAETPHIYLSLHNGIDGSAKDKIARLVHQIWAGHYAAVAEATLGRIGKGRNGSVDEEQPGWGGAQFQATEAETSQGNPIASVLSSRQSLPETSNAARLRLHQIRLRERAIQLLYEVCRVQRLDPVDMRAVDEHFVSHLFDLVEETRHHEDEAFNYQLIKVIAALNEQFMVSSLSSRSASKNVVMGILRSRLHVTKTFGENLIFMLNRASSHSAEDLCMQLLVLKLLYLLFTTQETAHYFYTNDLKVLVDVFIRELSDLPEDSESLRHTYLRVLHPLLTSTQLSTHPYKRPQIRRLLKALVTDSLYRGEVSATTRRLVQRCLEGEWCKELDRLDPDYVASASSSAAEAATAEPTQTSSSIRTIRPSTGPEQPTALLSPSLKAARMRGASVSASNTPPSYLDAPRFRSASSTMMSAQSAPTTPPPLPESAFPTAAPAVEVEDEAAMALADGRTTHDNEGDESWQHEYAREAHLDAEDGVDVEVNLQQQAQGTQSALLSPPLPHHRPVARRASHNEFKRPTVKPANIRRAPPPAPTSTGSNGSTTSGSGRRDGLPRTSSTDGGGTFAFLQNGDGLPSLHVQAPSSGNGDDQDGDVEGEQSADDEMSRSLGSIGMGGGGGDDDSLSRSSSPLRPSSASSATSKQQQRRRPPPAPPSLVATAVANSVSLDEPIRRSQIRERKSSLQETSEREGGRERAREGRREMVGSASHPGWTSSGAVGAGGSPEPEASASGGEEYGHGGDGRDRERSETPPSSAMSATSSSGTRRRPPPPPVNRATKAR